MALPQAWLIMALAVLSGCQAVGIGVPATKSGTPARAQATSRTPAAPASAGSLSGGSAAADGSAVPGDVATPAPGAPSASTGVAAMPASAGLVTGLIVAAEAAIISNNTASLVGKAKGPLIGDAGAGVVSNHGGAIVSNNGGSLINDGGPILWRTGFRLAALATSGVAGAQVGLVDAQDRPLGPLQPSGPDGAFNLARPAGVSQAFVRATFEQAGKAFTYRAAWDADEIAVANTRSADEHGLAGSTNTAPLVLDEAATLVAERIASGGRRPAPGLLARLVASVRSELIPELLPYMADDSRDRRAAFDQLVLDRPAVREAVAAAIPAGTLPTHTWRVETVISREILANHGHPQLAETFRLISAVLPRPEGGIIVGIARRDGLRIAALSDEAGLQPIAEMPTEASAPIRLGRGADGKLYAACRIREQSQIGVFVQGDDGAFTRRPGIVMDVPLVSDLDIGQIAVDAVGTVYAADTRAHVVRRLAAGEAMSTVVAGIEGQAGWVDGAATVGRLNAPESVALAPDGAVVVADTGNSALRRIGADGTLSTLVGKPGETPYRNGRGAQARLGAPSALAFSPEGDIFVVDRTDLRVRRLSRDGSVFLVAGTGVDGTLDGPGHEATFHRPGQIAFGGNGVLYLRDGRVGTDGSELVVRALTPPGFLR